MKLRMKKLALVLAIAMVTSVAVMGCGKSAASGQAGDNGSAGNGSKKITVIVKTVESPYFQTVKKGAEDAAKKYGASIDFVGAPGGESDINGQVTLVENAVSQKPDGVVLAASDAKAVAPAAQKLIDAKIPLALVDSACDVQDYLSYATTDNEEASYKVGKKLGELMGGKGKVAIVSFSPGAGSAVAREKGFNKAMKEFPDIQVVQTVYCDSDKAKALTLTQDIITAHPDITAIYGANEQSLVGVARGVKETNSKAIVAGFDSSDDVIPLLEDNTIKATAVQKPYTMGYDAVENIMKSLSGEKIEKSVDTGAVIVTPENMKDEESHKVLYPLG
ncbi:ABC transporter substrate-binding protein [uncultured Clostridium sp.]|uniref:ABC transporter substrate-binding protein n=1 Tax=uncultured Clostridium sp. TaxID=59620 RepID=UPI0028EB8E0D|nr:ABC transporter substrate-binding protein [uncultured Clostridium sp.]